MMQGGAPARRWGHAACLMGSDSASMLLCGGMSAPEQPLADCWVLHLEDMRWEAVDTVPTQLPLGRPLMPGNTTAMCAMAPTELGTCSATWSETDQVAIIWGGDAFWTWREPDAVCWQREKNQRRQEEAVLDSAAADSSKKGKREERRQRRESRDEGRSDGKQKELRPLIVDSPRGKPELRPLTVDSPRGELRPLRDEPNRPMPLEQRHPEAEWRPVEGTPDWLGRPQPSKEKKLVARGDLPAVLARGPPLAPIAPASDLPDVVPHRCRPQLAPVSVPPGAGSWMPEAVDMPPLPKRPPTGDAHGPWTAARLMREPPMVQSWPPPKHKSAGLLQELGSQPASRLDLGPGLRCGTPTRPLKPIDKSPPTPSQRPPRRPIRDGWETPVS